MFGLFKKQPLRDPYLEKVAATLHTTMTPMMQRENSYDLASECLGELQSHIARGTFSPGRNPREAVMAYYCLCSMVREAGAGDDKTTVLAVSIGARLLAAKFPEQETFTPLEQGICQFGERTLSEYFPNQSKDDITSLKNKAADIVFEIATGNNAPLSRQDAATLITNVCANIPETDTFKGGEKLLAISALASMTAYSIDQGDIAGANAYFACVNAAKKKYTEGQMASFNDYQTKALRVILSGYIPILNELMEANKRLAQLQFR